DGISMGKAKTLLLASLFLFSMEGLAKDEIAGSEDRDFKEKSLKLSGLEARILDMNNQLTLMIELKKREKDSEKSRELMKELVSQTKERNKAVSEHRQLKKHLLYRYPNMRDVIHKKYGVHEEASIE